MAKTILQVNYRFNVSPTELRQLITPAAAPIAAVDGLLWKVWLIDEDRLEAGGIYLFRDRAAVEAFLANPMMAGFAANPAIADVSARIFAVDTTLSQITRGPLESVTV